ncbi:FkbM family methyltransferase [Pseudoalteromonas luteoviolacea]|uniref:FkbM family methyltransferase n=1 Tax=Pseudoalteromonas luteoviolacea TaxID=43657 RepID=UPI00114F2491|nr:FkbM family methyltransferase [Pseudoalteromonas luteoviolacea]TQF69923.1 FkbM family methyltransferase [Pseudoalteromonas luteoviolacea]
MKSNLSTSINMGEQHMAKTLIERFLKSDERKYIFGTTSEAKALIALCQQQGIEIAGVIDNFYQGEQFEGAPCCKLVDAIPQSLVLSAVTNSRPLEVAELLTKSGFTHIDYYSFFRLSGLPCPKIDFWAGAEQHWHNNEHKYREVRELFEETKSKEIFDAVVSFRTSYDLEHMKGFAFDISNMYIEPFVLPFKDEGVFFDLGAFDGSDTLRFLSLCNSGKSYMFEPIPEQVDKLNNIANNTDKISVVPVAVGNESKQVQFCLGGTSSKVSTDGEPLENSIKVQQLSLDEFCEQHHVVPEYVKMDVEGAEQDVILGMETLLTQHKPKLAVSVYHRVEDIIDIPLMIKRANPEYKFYLRHYTQGYSETVLFAV